MATENYNNNTEVRIPRVYAKQPTARRFSEYFRRVNRDNN